MMMSKLESHNNLEEFLHKKRTYSEKNEPIVDDLLELENQQTRDNSSDSHNAEPDWENAISFNQFGDKNLEVNEVDYQNRNNEETISDSEEELFDPLKKNKRKKRTKAHLKTKIKTHFFNFIIDFFNGLIRGGLFNYYNVKFRKISHPEKANTTISTNKVLMQQKIQDILALNVSQQYRKKAEQNKINLERLKKYLQRNEKKHQLLMKICELPIKTFYEKMYLAQNYENIFSKNLR